MSIGGFHNPVRGVGGASWRGSRVQRPASPSRSSAKESPEDHQGPDGNDAWVSAWSSALDELEIDVEQAEQLLAGGNPSGDSAASAAQVSPQVPARRQPPSSLGGPSAHGATQRRLGNTYHQPPAPPAPPAPQAQPSQQHRHGEGLDTDTGGGRSSGLPSDQAWQNWWEGEQTQAAVKAFDAEQSGSVEAGLGPAQTEPWSPPNLQGVLPDELAQRAATLLNRQLAVAQSLARAMLGNRQQSGLLERMDHTPKETRSAYFDHNA